jgi:hypothetical protein
MRQWFGVDPPKTEGENPKLGILTKEEDNNIVAWAATALIIKGSERCNKLQSHWTGLLINCSGLNPETFHCVHQGWKI